MKKLVLLVPLSILMLTTACAKNVDVTPVVSDGLINTTETQFVTTLIDYYNQESGYDYFFESYEDEDGYHRFYIFPEEHEDDAYKYTLDPEDTLSERWPQEYHSYFLATQSNGEYSVNPEGIMYSIGLVYNSSSDDIHDTDEEYRRLCRIAVQMCAEEEMTPEEADEIVAKVIDSGEMIVISGDVCAWPWTGHFGIGTKYCYTSHTSTYSPDGAQIGGTTEASYTLWPDGSKTYD